MPSPSRCALLALLALPAIAFAQQSKPTPASGVMRARLTLRNRRVHEDPTSGSDVRYTITADLEPTKPPSEQYQAAVSATINDGAPMKEAASVKRSKGLWAIVEDEKSEGQLSYLRYLISAVNLGPRLKSGLVKDRELRPGMSWTSTRKSIAEAFGDIYRFREPAPNSVVRLRFIGERSVTGVPCLAFSLRWTDCWIEGDSGVEIRASCTGLVVFERDSLQTRLVNLAEFERRSEDGESTASPDHILRLRVAFGPKPPKKLR